MPLRLRTLLLAATVALYGFGSLVGQALHGVEGFDHSRATLGSGDEAGRDQAARLDGAHGDCPVCVFLAMGALVDDPARLPAVDVVLLPPADEPPATVPPAVDRPSIPRAPPLI